MKRRFRFVNLCLLVTFIVIIFIPLLKVNKTAGNISSAENRVLASFPAFSVNGKINTQFISQFESWFNDNLGLRDKLVTANTKAEYQLFGKLTKTDTMVGKNNWLYYVTPEIIKDYQHLNLPSEKQLNEWNTSLNRVNSFLAKRNIPFIVMLNLDKKTIYPENYPDSILKIGDTSRTDMISNYFSRKGNFTFFTPKNALLEAKRNAVVYSQNYDNAHWNYYGSFIGYMELMKQVKKFIPSIHSLALDDFDISPYQREVKVYNSVSFKETDYNFNFNRNRTAVESGITDLQQLNLVYNEVSYPAHEYINKNKNLPVALVIGDSYLYQHNLPDMAESFSKLVFVHNENINKIESLVNVVKPDIVIYETVERTFDHSMYLLTNTSESLEDPEGYQKYSNLPVMENRTANPNLWIDYFDNQLTPNQNVLKIQGNDEFVNISGWAIDANNGKVANEVYLKVGNQIIPAQYGIERASVAVTLNNSDLLNSGFLFSVRTSDLKKYKKFELITISNDKTFQYKPLEFKVTS